MYIFKYRERERTKEKDKEKEDLPDWWNAVEIHNKAPNHCKHVTGQIRCYPVCLYVCLGCELKLQNSSHFCGDEDYEEKNRK